MAKSYKSTSPFVVIALVAGVLAASAEQFKSPAKQLVRTMIASHMTETGTFEEELKTSREKVMDKYAQVEGTGELAGKTRDEKRALHYKLVIGELGNLKDRIEKTRLEGTNFDLRERRRLEVRVNEVKYNYRMEPITEQEMRKALKITQTDVEAAEKKRVGLLAKLANANEDQVAGLQEELRAVTVELIVDIMLDAYLKGNSYTLEAIQQAGPKEMKADLVKSTNNMIEYTLVWSNAKIQ